MFKSYVISLKNSARRQGIVETFAEAKQPFEFVDANDPPSVRELSAAERAHYFETGFYEDKKRELRWGTLACSLSHARLWERLGKELPADEIAALIFEDDVRLDTCFQFNLARILSDVGDDLGGYDIIFFPGWVNDERYTTPQMATHRYLSRMVNFTLTSTAGYIIRRSSLDKFISTVLPLKEVDVYIAFLRDKLKIGLTPIWPHLLQAQVLPSERLVTDDVEKALAKEVSL
jgi:GR25 family glycosyltransferase involved in LPS biosynthesis